MDKTELRKTRLAFRRALSPEDWQQKSDRLCQNLTALPQYQDAVQRSEQVMLAYFSTRQEPDLSKLWSREPLTGKAASNPQVVLSSSPRFGFPCCVGEQLLWRSWRSGDPLMVGKFGIREPVSSEENIISPEQVSLILVPCVGCSPQGFRVGYGGGFYDRMLSQPVWQKVLTIGITFEMGVVDGWQPEPWDHQCSLICTEERIYFPKIDSN